jgi:hypothetical protein
MIRASSFLTKPTGFPALRALLQKVHDYWAVGSHAEKYTGPGQAETGLFTFYVLV